MKSLLMSLLFLTPPVLAEELHVTSFGGEDNFTDSYLIADTDAQSCANIITDEGDLRPMPGSARLYDVGLSSIMYLGEYIDSSGNRSTLVQSGADIQVSNPSGMLTTITTLSATRDVDAVSAFNSVYFVDQTAPFYYNGSSVTAFTQMPQTCRYIEHYANRLVCANISTDTSKLYLSEYNNPLNWTVGSVASSPVEKYMNRGNGEGITCLKATPYGLFVGKTHSTKLLKADDADTFYWYTLSDTVGCIDDRSVQVADGAVLWAGNTGVYAYGGSGSIEPISKKIFNTYRYAKAGNSTEQSWTISTGAGWKSGTSTGWETTIQPGILKAQTYNYKASELTPLAYSGEICGTNNATLVLGMFNATSGALISSAAFAPNPSSPYTYTPALVDLKTFTDQDVKLGVYGVGGEAYTAYSSTFSGLRGGALYFNVRTTGQCNLLNVSATSPAISYAHPDFTANSTITAQGVYDSSLTSPDYEVPTASGTDVSGVTVDFYTSADGSSWSGMLTFPLSDSEKQRYWRYGFEFGASSPTINHAQISVLSPATYYSPVQDTGGSLASWKTINLTVSADSGSNLFTLQTRSSSTIFGIDNTTVTWVDQTNGAVVAAGVYRYLQYRIIPVLTSTDTLKFVSSIVTWVTGSAAPRMASLYHEGRYVLCFSTTSTTQNDICEVLQRNGEWVPITGVSYGALGIYNNTPIAGDGTTGSKVWNILQDGIYQYDGAAINSHWITKDFALGKLNHHKVLDRFWISADNSPTASFTVGWQKDRNGVWYSSKTVLNDSSFVVRELDGLFLNEDPTARQFRFKFSNAELDRWFRLKLYSVYFRVNELIK